MPRATGECAVTEAHALVAAVLAPYSLGDRDAGDSPRAPAGIASSHCAFGIQGLALETFFGFLALRIQGLGFRVEGFCEFPDLTRVPPL